MKFLPISLLLSIFLSLPALASDQAKSEAHMPTKKCTLQNFQHLKLGTDVKTVFSDFGEPLRDIGSGIHIYEYKIDDGSIIRVGCVNTVLYVDHVQGKQSTRLAGATVDPASK